MDQVPDATVRIQSQGKSHFVRAAGIAESQPVWESATSTHLHISMWRPGAWMAAMSWTRAE